MPGRAGFPGAILMLQSVAWVGIYGLSFLTVLAASLPALLGTPRWPPLSPRPALRPGDRRGVVDPGAGPGGRDPAGNHADPLDTGDLAAPRPAVDPAEPEMGPGRRGRQFPAPPRPQRRPGDPPDRGGAVAGGGRSLSPRARCIAPPRDRRGRAGARLCHHRRGAGKPAAAARSRRSGTASRR